MFIDKQHQNYHQQRCDTRDHIGHPQASRSVQNIPVYAESERRHKGLDREQHAVYLFKSVTAEYRCRQRCGKVGGSAQSQGKHDQEDDHARPGSLLPQ